MKKYILYICVCLTGLFSMVAQAQTEDEQVLIFHKSGEVNLLYTSEINSITLTCTDTLGEEHAEPVAQLFCTADTTYYVDIADIDSVCFGSRNEIELYDDVRVMTSAESEPWIVRYEDNTIYFKKDTPVGLLPIAGTKLLYGEQTEMFPVGLTAKVESVSPMGDEIAVRVQHVGIEDIFNKLFYAGNMYDLPNALNNAKKHVLVLDKSEPIKLEQIPLPNKIGELSINGMAKIHGDFVLAKERDFYSATFKLNFTFGRELKLNCNKKKTWEYTTEPIPIASIPVTPIVLVAINFGLFAEVEAEASLVLSESMNKNIGVYWQCINKKMSVKPFTINEPGTNSQKVKNEAVFSGKASFGLVANLDVTLVGVAGIRAKAKLGPEISGSLSSARFAELSKSSLTVGASAGLELSYTNNLRFSGHGLILKKESEAKMTFPPIMLTKPAKLSLMPTISKTLAVKSGTGRPGTAKQMLRVGKRAAANDGAHLVSVSTKTDTKTETDIETGFQLVDKEGNVLDSMFVEDRILGGIATTQGIATKLSVPRGVNLDETFVRPVIHYAGYTIPYESVGIAQDPNLQPVISWGSNGAATYVSGIPTVAVTRVDSMVAHVGPNVPMAVYDKVFYPDDSPYKGIEGYAFPGMGANIIGTWTGVVDNIPFTLNFSEDYSGTMQEGTAAATPFTYILDYPQSGSIALKFADEDVPQVVIKVEQLMKESMRVRFRNAYKANETVVLNKQ